MTAKLIMTVMLVLTCVAAVEIMPTTTTFSPKFTTTTTTTPPTACARACMNTMRTTLDTIFGVPTVFNTDTIAQYDHVHFTKTVFTDMRMKMDMFCTNYTIMTSCLNECGTFDGLDMMLAVFKPIEFICIDKREEFMTYAPCYETVITNVGYAHTCYNQCGNATYINAHMNNFTTLMQTFAFDKMQCMVAEADTLCTYALCMLDCRRPQFIEACNTTAPWTLARMLISKTMAPVTTVMHKFDIEKIMPKSCRKMAMLEDSLFTTTTPTVMPTSTFAEYVITEPTTLIEMTKICTQPVVQIVSECTMPTTMWWFNVRTMKCETFKFCATITTTMTNRFATQEMCMNVCGGMITVTTDMPLTTTTTDDFETRLILETATVGSSDFLLDSNATVITNTTTTTGDGKDDEDDDDDDNNEDITVIEEKVTRFTIVKIKND